MVKYLFVIIYLCVVMFLNLFFYVCFDHLFHKPLLQFTLIARLFTIYLQISFILSTHLNSTAAYVLII